MIIRLTVLTTLLFLHNNLYGQPVFDAHLHYNKSDTDVISPVELITILEGHHVPRALVTSSPPRHAEKLYRLYPQHIIPFLGVYRQKADKQEWHQDNRLPDYVSRQIEKGIWQGIGELHIFSTHRHSPVLRQLVKLARQHQLPLLMHADPAVIDTIYETEPDVRVIWAHAGTYPYPDLLQDYLELYPYLYIDLSVRDERIAPDGIISDEWYNLFIRFPDRFLVGVDTYSTLRWEEYDKVINGIRHWLNQLPDDVRRKISYSNAAELLETESTDTSQISSD